MVDEKRIEERHESNANNDTRDTFSGPCTNILAGNTLKLWTDGGEEDDDGVVSRAGKNLVE